MNITMQCSQHEEGVSGGTWDVAIIGPVLDDRGKAARNFASRHSRRIVECIYKPESFSLLLDNQIFTADQPEDALRSLGEGKILLETTTMGFPEVYLACRALKALARQHVSMLYVEPREYAAKSQLLDRRDFELSEEVLGFISIPGATILLDDRACQRGVFFLGYEERRLDRAIR